MVADIYEFEIKHHSLNMYGRCVRENCPNREAEGDAESNNGKTTAKEAAAKETEA
jgi:Fur family ferric uptake transcriptional regulator